MAARGCVATWVLPACLQGSVLLFLYRRRRLLNLHSVVPYEQSGPNRRRKKKKGRISLHSAASLTSVKSERMRLVTVMAIAGVGVAVVVHPLDRQELLLLEQHRSSSFSSFSSPQPQLIVTCIFGQSRSVGRADTSSILRAIF